MGVHACALRGCQSGMTINAKRAATGPTGEIARLSRPTVLRHDVGEGGPAAPVPKLEAGLALVRVLLVSRTSAASLRGIPPQRRGAGITRENGPDGHLLSVGVTFLSSPQSKQVTYRLLTDW